MHMRTATLARLRPIETRSAAPALATAPSIAHCRRRRRGAVSGALGEKPQCTVYRAGCHMSVEPSGTSPSCMVGCVLVLLLRVCVFGRGGGKRQTLIASNANWIGWAKQWES